MMAFKALCVGLFCVLLVTCIYTPVPDNIEESWKVTALDLAVKTCSFVGFIFSTTLFLLFMFNIKWNYVGKQVFVPQRNYYMISPNYFTGGSDWMASEIHVLEIDFIDCIVRMAMCFENIGIMKYEEFISIIFRLDYTLPRSDEYITVTDTAFVDVPVRLYLPKRKSETPRRAVIYIHGGAFCFGSFKQTSSDLLNRWTANRLDAVVIGLDYRLTPQYHFPAQFEDSITVVKFFLQDKILRKYGVDPTRVCISGDSSGGTLAAAVTQQVQNDPEIKHKIKMQALLYPALQVIDSCLPSHRENEHGIVLTRDIAIKLVSLYFTKDKALPQAMRRNQHMPLESRPLFQFVNWSVLLPEKYRKDYVYKEPILGRSSFSLPALMDYRASPLLANDSQLQTLPQTYVLTCQYDLLRDDGLMYVSRLRSVGVQVAHDHIEDGIHAALSFMTSPFYLQVGLRIKDMYINWLNKNL